MSNLNKENFWNELYAKFPRGTQIFCDWIDEYKKAEDWNKLFNSDSEYQNAKGKNAPAPKFHDLPYAMQLGIWIEFVKSRTENDWDMEIFSDDFDLAIDISEYVEHVLEEASKQSKSPHQ